MILKLRLVSFCLFSFSSCALAVSSLSSPLLSRPVLSPRVVGFHPPFPALSLLSVRPSLPAALWQQSVMGLGCRRTIKAPACPSSSSSYASLHLCCPHHKGPAQSVFTQVMRRACWRLWPKESTLSSFSLPSSPNHLRMHALNHHV